MYDHDLVLKMQIQERSKVMKKVGSYVTLWSRRKLVFTVKIGVETATWVLRQPLQTDCLNSC